MTESTARYQPCLQSVYDFMIDGREHTIVEGVAATKLKADCFAALLRDLRKPRFGGHTVLRRTERSPGQSVSYFRLIPRSES